MTANPGDVHLTDDADKHIEIYAEAFNSGDAARLDELYTADAVITWGPDGPLSGQARRDYVADFLRLKPVMEARTRHSYVTGDTALMVVEWAIDTTDEDGKTEHFEGVALDVLRRGDDGYWRHAIDDPYGEVTKAA